MNSSVQSGAAASRLDFLAQHIAARLERDELRLRESFERSVTEVGVRYFVVDELLPEAVVRNIHEVFPAPAAMRLMDSFREKKYTSKQLDRFDPVLSDITFAMQAPAVVRLIEQITGIQQQLPDSSLYAGGLSAMLRGHFLGPHIDNSHDQPGERYRTVNLLYYLTPEWSLESGGNLELWDRKVKRSATIVSAFNRLVVMETNPWSWHSVSPVTVDRVRCCVSNYYFSRLSPTGSEYRNVTSFSARPEQKVRRMLAWADGRARALVRVIASGGVGKKDVYGGRAGR